MTANKNLLIVTSFPVEQAGYLDFSYRIKSLAKSYDLTIISNSPLIQAELQIESADYVVLTEERQGRLAWLRYMWNCAHLIRVRRPSRIVLLQSSIAPLALMCSGIPTALYWNEHPTHIFPEPHGFAPIKYIVRSAFRWLMFLGARKADIVMPIGEAHRDDLLAHGCNAERIRMIYMGVDGSFSGVALPGLRKSQDAPLELIYIGAIRKDRGRDVMLEAIAQVNEQEIIARLTLVGARVEDLEYCNQYARQLGIDEAVTIHGRVDGDAIPKFLSKADFGLCLWEDQPWWHFNPPTKLFEYLVAGLPVLASNIRTHTQYISDWHNGLIFEYNSTSLAQAIMKCWEHRTEIPQMKLVTKNTGEPYIWQRIESEFLKAIDKLGN
jgi:glycosyltransferase involved in cell wall biosynthesis